MAEKTTTGAEIVGTTDDDFDSIIDGASLPERPVPMCLDGKLRGAYEAVKARVEERAALRDAERTAAGASTLNDADTRLSAKGPEAPPADERDPEQDHLDELAAKMRAKAVTFIVRAMPSQEYNRLLEQHGPRKDTASGRFDPRDLNGYNAATFPPALVRKSIVQPTMTDERWAKLAPKLNDAQFDRLYLAAAEINRRDEDIPF